MNEAIAAGLSESQRLEFDRDGYLILDGYLDPASVAALSGAIDRVEAHFSPIQPGTPGIQVDQTADGFRIRLAEPVLHLDPVFVSLAEDPRITQLFQDLFAESPTLFEDKVNFKSPRGGSFFPMHQDYSYWQPYSPRLTSAMIYVDEATAENGCLKVVPGMHTRGLLPKTGVPVNERITDHRLPEEIVDPALAFEAPGAPGTVILFSCLTPHASAPNLSDRPRRAIILTYGPASAGDSYQERYGRPRPLLRSHAR